MSIISWFHSEELNRTFQLQKNTVYKLQSLQFSTTYKHKNGRKVNKQISYVSTKPQMNYNRRFSKSEIKNLRKIPSKDLEN